VEEKLQGFARGSCSIFQQRKFCKGKGEEKKGISFGQARKNFKKCPPRAKINLVMEWGYLGVQKEESRLSGRGVGKKIAVFSFQWFNARRMAPYKVRKSHPPPRNH